MKSSTAAKKRKQSTADRFAVLNAFMDFTARDLRHSEFLVWMTIYRDTRNGIATASQRSIAERCGKCRKTVERAISQLIHLGLLRRIRPGGFRRGSATYQVLPVSRERFEQLQKKPPNPTADPSAPVR